MVGEMRLFFFLVGMGMQEQLGCGTSVLLPFAFPFSLLPSLLQEKTMNTDPILTTLESAANQIFAVVAPNTVRLVRVGVILSDEAETAATDGRILIQMPTAFHGVELAQNLPVAIGLLAHEVSHFLQPLDQVESVEEEERIPHWLVNIAIDIQGESLVESLFPAFSQPLAAVRRTVQKDRQSDYEADVAQAKTFAEAAGHLALYARHVKPLLPFYPDRLPNTCPEQGRCLAFLQTLDAFRTHPAQEIPKALVHLIRDFPELRLTPAPLFPDGMEKWPSPIKDIFLQALRQEALGNTGASGGGTVEALQIHAAPARAFLPDAEALSRHLQPHFTGRQAVAEVTAPGRFLRRAAVREIVPFRLRLPGHTDPATKLALCIDASGSMGSTCPGSNGSSKWHVAQLAAQALALAVQRTGGQTVGVVFGDFAWSTGVDSLALALEYSDQRARTGGGTSFRFLSDLWRRYPEHRILVLTDGAGTPPACVLPGDRERTRALIIPTGDPSHAAAWSSRQVVLKDLRHLGQVLALLTPRSG